MKRTREELRAARKNNGEYKELKAHLSSEIDKNSQHAASNGTVKNQQHCGEEMAPQTLSVLPAADGMLFSESSTAVPPKSAEKVAALLRLMHAVPRSDVLRIQKCRLDRFLCQKAAECFTEDFTAHPVRYLTLQLGCSVALSSSPNSHADEGKREKQKINDGFQYFLKPIFFHRYNLRELDLSRNDLSAGDVKLLCDGLGLRGELQLPSSARSENEEVRASSRLRLINLSYNCRIGNEGVCTLLSGIRNLCGIKAVILRCVGLDDKGALAVAPMLRRRPPPKSDVVAEEVVYSRDRGSSAESFFVNLNENRIGSEGTFALGKGLPSYVSLSVCKQVIKPG